MKFLEYTNLFDHPPAEIACLSTFNSDPEFFERRLLRTEAFEQAQRILVLMDAGQWRKLMTEDVPARWMNRRYLMVPIHRQGGVFHPKLNLLLGVKGVSLHCGTPTLRGLDVHRIWRCSMLRRSHLKTDYLLRATWNSCEPHLTSLSRQLAKPLKRPLA